MYVYIYIYVYIHIYIYIHTQDMGLREGAARLISSPEARGQSTPRSRLRRGPAAPFISLIIIIMIMVNCYHKYDY